MSDVESRVKEVVAKQLGVAEADLKTESHVVNDLGADSIDEVELVMALEDEFRLDIPDEVADSHKTVGSMVEWLQANAK